MSTLVAVPVKDLANAKQRLIPLLSAAERHDLASAMLEDVLETLARARLGPVLVVTRDREVESLALKFGEPSFQNHVVAARAAGLKPVVLRMPGIGLDIDEPEDLTLLLGRGPSTRSAALLRRLAVPIRLASRLETP